MGSENGQPVQQTIKEYTEKKNSYNVVTILYNIVVIGTILVVTQQHCRIVTTLFRCDNIVTTL